MIDDKELHRAVKLWTQQEEVNDLLAGYDIQVAIMDLFQAAESFAQMDSVIGAYQALLAWINAYVEEHPEAIGHTLTALTIYMAAVNASGEEDEE